MKINDVITEAGVWDTIKRAAGGVAGAAAGYSQAKSQRQGQQEITTLARDMMPYWQKQVQALKSSGVNMADVATYQQQFLDWLTKTGFPGQKDFSKGLGPLKSTSPVDVAAYLQKAVALHSSGQVPTTTANTDTTQDQGAAVFGNMARTLSTMQPPGTTSTGGSVTQTPAGLKHTAKPASNTVQPDTAPAQSAAPDAAQIIANLEKTVPQDVLMSVATELMKKYTLRATPE